MTSEHDRLISEVVGWAIPHLSVVQAHQATEPPSPNAWDALTETVVAERIAGLLWRAIEAGMPVTHLQRIQAASMAHDSMRSVVQLEATAQWVVAQLDSAGIDVRLIKGLATAHAIHPDVGLRDSGDIDLLVHPRDLARSAEVLDGAGLRPETRWGPGANAFTKELVFVSETGVEIDLHQSLNFGARWRRMTPRLMADGVEIGSSHHSGPNFTTLNVEGLFISAAISACRSDGRISGLLDVATVSHDRRLVPDRLAALLAAEALGPAITPVLAKTARFFTVQPEVRDAVLRSPRTRRGGFCSRMERSETGARYLYSCLSGHPRDWPQGLGALVRPDDAHFDDEDTGRRNRIKRIGTQSGAMARSLLAR